MARYFQDSGPDSINCTDINEIDGADQITISFWGKKTATNKNLLVGKGNSATSGIWVNPYSNGSVYFTARNSASGTAHVAFNNTNWNHYVMVYDGTQGVANDRVIAYINNAIQSLTYTSDPPTTLGSGAAQFNIGSFLGVNSDGYFAHVKVWDVPLTIGEVSSDYYGIIPRIGNLLGYWPLGLSSPEPDWSGQAHNGTLSNSPTVSDGPPVKPPWVAVSLVPYIVAAGGPPVGTLSMMGVGR